MSRRRQLSVTLCESLCYLVCLELICGVRGFHSQSQVDLCSGGDGVRKDCGGDECCVPLDHCPTFCREKQNLDVNITIRSLLHELQCGFRDEKPMVCCPGLSRVPSEPACRDLNMIHPQSEVDLCSAGDGVRKDCGGDECCVPLDHCPTFCRDALNIDVNITIRLLIHEKQCGFHNGEPMICCPGLTQVPSGPACQMNKEIKEIKENKESIKSNKQYFCGEPDSFVYGRITGGTSSLPGEWPWMAALEYCNTQTQDTQFLCSGVLISRQWVLTAGHCIDMLHEGVEYDLEEVRVGDTDFSKEYDCRCLPLEGNCEDYCGDQEDCLKENRCVPKHQSFKPIQQVKHPRFKKLQDQIVYSYDIALVKLDRPVELNNFARPVCLPDKRRRRNEEPNFIVTGWGRIHNVFSGHLRLKPETAEILQAIRVDMIDHTECNRKFARRGVTLKKEHLCAATGTAGKSVCQGDSGGALVTPLGNVWFLEGVVSFGSSLCGDPGPTVFSRLGKQKINWIRSVVDENLPKRRPK